MLKTIMLRDPDNKAALAGRLPLVCRLRMSRSNSATNPKMPNTNMADGDVVVWIRFSRKRNCPPFRPRINPSRYGANTEEVTGPRAEGACLRWSPRIGQEVKLGST